MQLGTRSRFPPVLLFTAISRLCRKPGQNWERMTQNGFLSHWQLLLPRRRAIHFDSIWTLIPFSFLFFSSPAKFPRCSFQVGSLRPSHHAAAIVRLLFCTPTHSPPYPLQMSQRGLKMYRHTGLEQHNDRRLRMQVDVYVFFYWPLSKFLATHSHDSAEQVKNE